MKEYLLAILEDNPDNQRQMGLQDADIIEIYEQSVEVISFNEELSKKTSFSQVCTWLKGEHAKNGGQKAMEGGGCCGDEKKATPDSVVMDFLVPKLNDCLLEILSEAPFQGQTKLTTPSGVAIDVKPEMILITLLNHTSLVLGTKQL